MQRTCSRRVCFKIFRFNWHVKTSTKQQGELLLLLSLTNSLSAAVFYDLEYLNTQLLHGGDGEIIHTSGVVMHFTDCTYKYTHAV